MGNATSGLRSLAAMAHLLARQSELNDLLETAAEHARVAMGAATVAISAIVPDGEAIRTIINVGDLAPGEERWPDNETYSIAGDARLAATVLKRMSSVDDVDDPACPLHQREQLIRLGKGSSLTTAIVVDGQAWGEMYVTRHIGHPAFDEDAIAYAEVLSAILAAAVSSSIRETTLQKLAFHDPLTGLLNRRALDEHAARLFELGDDPARDIAVVAIDINGLKLVNDTSGHATGDRVIRDVAAALSHAFAPLTSSVVARAGGDEFTVLVAGRDVGMVEQTVNVLCRDVSKTSSLTGLSAGIAAVVLTRAFTFSMSEVFAAADRALYVAKRTGSRTAVIADDFTAPRADVG
jgi:diguanylate cyclase (GGDEF)-like protein